MAIGDFNCHVYKVGVAKEVGLNAAVILDGLVGWVNHNAANGANVHDGYVWTYNSIKAWSELYPELSRKQVENALRKLEDNGYIICGNYNKTSFDRTKWYAVTEKGLRYYSISPLGEMDSPSGGNGFPRGGEPIPTNYTATYDKENPTGDGPSFNEPMEAPSVEDVETYCEMTGQRINAAKFVANYASTGWRKGNTPITDWRPLVALWYQNDKERKGEQEARKASLRDEKAAEKAARSLVVPIPDIATEDGRKRVVAFSKAIDGLSDQMDVKNLWDWEDTIEHVANHDINAPVDDWDKPWVDANQRVRKNIIGVVRRNHDIAAVLDWAERTIDDPSHLGPRAGDWRLDITGYENWWTR